jgi:hypothetical protein
VTTPHIFSSCVGCLNKTFSLIMTLKIYLNILLYIDLNLQILSSFCRYIASHSLRYRYGKKLSIWSCQGVHISLSILQPPHFLIETYLFSLNFIKLLSKKFLSTLSSFTIKLCRHIFIYLL